MIYQQMNNSIYYSQEEQHIKTQIPVNSHNFQAETDFQSDDDLSIEEYQKLFKEKSSSLPLKNIIVYQVKQASNQTPQLETQQTKKILNIKQPLENKHCNQIKHKSLTKKHKFDYYEEEQESFISNEVQEGEQFITRSKYRNMAETPSMPTRSRHQIPFNTENSFRQLPIEPRSYHPPQTKFRHLDINKRRKRHLPPRIHLGNTIKLFNKGNLQIDSINVKQQQENIKIPQNLYFSEDQEQKIKQETQEKIIKRQQILPLSKNIQIIIAQPQKREGRIIINRHNLIKMFENASLSFKLMSYESLSNEDPIYKWFFQQTIQDLSYKNSAEKSSHILSKGRLYLVRRAMEIYSNIPPKQHKEERFVRNRLTKAQRILMLRKNLPIPPPRLTSDFLAALFVNADFAGFFTHFIKTGKMEEILLNRSKTEIRNFGLYYQRIFDLSSSFQEKCKMIKHNPAPLSLLEVKLFMEEGRELCEKYC